MKTWIRGTNAIVLSLAAIGIFIVLTIFLHSLKGVQWDLTKNKKFTLADQTVTTLKQLDHEVHVVAFSNPDEGMVNRQITDLLAEYHKRNSKFTYEEVDPKKKPTMAEKYKIEQYGTIVFESDGKTKNVYENELFAQGDAQGSYNFVGEEKFTQAILGLTSNEKHTVYFLGGHGELTTQAVGQLTSSLQNEGYEVKDLNLVKEAKIPDDAETIFILGPQNDISDKEVSLLQTYVKDKGKLLYALDLAKGIDTWKNWPSLLSTVGIKSENALAVEMKQSLSGDPLTIVPDYANHEITNKLEQQNRVTVLPGALALTTDSTNQDVQATALLKTSNQSYGKTNLAVLISGKQVTQSDINKTDKDIKGPLNLAYAIQDKEGKPKAVVIGNGVFLTNDIINEQGNRDFILNSVGWLQGQKNQLTIRPREEAQLQQAVMTPGQARTVEYGTLVVIPLLFLIAGGAIWWRRRKG